jgi:hypothetical protein
MEIVHEREMAMTDDAGKAYAAVRVYAHPQTGGTWAGVLEFVPADGSRAVRSARETTQSSPDGVAYWATGLEPLYFEGALARALREPLDVTPASAPSPRGRHLVRIEVDTIDPQLPLRVMATRTLVRGFRRRIHNAGAILYEGATRQGRYAFTVQFGSDNAAALIANHLWSEVRNAARVRVEGRPIDNTHAALKDALLAATADRLAG